MTVYAINNLITKEHINVYKKYLGVKHFTLMYSDWLNEFSIRISKGERYDKHKKNLILKRIIQTYKLRNLSIEYIKKNGIQIYK